MGNNKDRKNYCGYRNSKRFDKKYGHMFSDFDAFRVTQKKTSTKQKSYLYDSNLPSLPSDSKHHFEIQVGLGVIIMKFVT